jgi:hypothetical protein
MRNETASDFSRFPHGGGCGHGRMGVDQHSVCSDRIVFLTLQDDHAAGGWMIVAVSSQRVVPVKA